MTKPTSANITSRRGVMKIGAAAVLAASPVAAITAPAPAVDPIYAAIKNYRQASAAFESFGAAMDAAQEATRDALPPEWEAGYDRHGEAGIAAANAFCTTTPTTLAGIIAALEFARTEHEKGNLFLDGGGWKRLAFSVERAAVALTSV